jgi:hypothetical protein
MDLSNLNFIRLTTEHAILPFDCGDADLNDFLFYDAKDYLRKLLSVTYLIESQDRTLAFFSVHNDKISIEDFDSNRKFRRFIQGLMPDRKKFKSYPAVKIGRLGVDHTCQKCGLGSFILDYIKGLFITNNRTGCQYITVDAYRQSLSFYQRNNFEFFTEKDKDEDTRQMYCSLIPLMNE